MQNGVVQELKAKKLQMAALKIKLQQAENRRTVLLLAAQERARKEAEAAEFEAMKQRVLQLEKMVAASAAAVAGATIAPVGPLLNTWALSIPDALTCTGGHCREIASLTPHPDEPDAD